MSDWKNKIKEETKGWIAEAEQELTALEGGDTVDLAAEDGESSDESTTNDESTTSDESAATDDTEGGGAPKT